MNGIVFHQFCYQEQNGRNSGLFGMDRIVSNRVLLVILPVFRWKNCVPRLPRSHHLNFCMSAILFAQSLFFWELIFCMLCYSYTGIRNDGIVPKECALYCKHMFEIILPPVQIQYTCIVSLCYRHQALNYLCHQRKCLGTWTVHSFLKGSKGFR